VTRILTLDVRHFRAFASTARHRSRFFPRMLELNAVARNAVIPVGRDENSKGLEGAGITGAALDLLP
jgi:hypothetical protein